MSENFPPFDPQSPLRRTDDAADLPGVPDVLRRGAQRRFRRRAATTGAASLAIAGVVGAATMLNGGAPGVVTIEPAASNSVASQTPTTSSSVSSSSTATSAPSPSETASVSGSPTSTATPDTTQTPTQTQTQTAEPKPTIFSGAMLAYIDLPATGQGNEWTLSYSAGGSFCWDPKVANPVDVKQWTYRRDLDGEIRPGLFLAESPQAAEQLLTSAKANVEACLSQENGNPAVDTSTVSKRNVAGGTVWTFGTTCRNECDYETRVVGLARVGSTLVYVDSSRMVYVEPGSTPVVNQEYSAIGRRTFQHAMERATLVR